jgi:hypothetical protein
MSRPEVLLIRVFSYKAGVVGIQDVPMPDTDMEEAETAAMERLEMCFSEGRFARAKPTQAQLVGEDNRIIAEFRREPHGVKKVRPI